MFLTAQIFGALALVSFFITFQIKKRRYLLLWLTIGNTFLSLNYLFMGLWFGVVLGLLGAFRSIVFLMIERREREAREYRVSQKAAGVQTPWQKIEIFGLCFLIFCLILNTVFLSITAENLLHWIILVVAIIFITSTYLESKHFIRIISIVYSSLLLALNVQIQNYMMIALEITILMSILIFYVRFVGERVKGNKQIVDMGQEVDVAEHIDTEQVMHTQQAVGAEQAVDTEQAIEQTTDTEQTLDAGEQITNN
ncbi:MAG: YgjV family protein [Firmicutes bacterium]|nr:YgjV family protein [Bacillota bacterium]